MRGGNERCRGETSDEKCRREAEVDVVLVVV